MREGEEGCFYPGVLHGWCGGWESHSLRREPPGPWWRVITVLRRGAVYQAPSQGPCSIFTTLVLAGDGRGNRHREGSVLPLLGGVRTQAETPLAASVPSPSLPVAGGAPQTPPQPSPRSFFLSPICHQTLTSLTSSRPLTPSPPPSVPPVSALREPPGVGRLCPLPPASSRSQTHRSQALSPHLLRPGP